VTNFKVSKLAKFWNEAAPHRNVKRKMQSHVFSQKGFPPVTSAYKLIPFCQLVDFQSILRW
jgi:hypothetical protein